MELTDIKMQEKVRAEWDAYLDTIDLEKIPKHQFSRQFERNMKRIIRHMFPASGSHGWKRFVKAAVIVVVSLAVAFSGLMTVEAFRERVIHFFTQVFFTHTNVEISTEGYTDTKFVPLQFGYLPDGMEQIDCQQNDLVIKRTFEKNNSFMIVDQIIMADDQEFQMGIDTENTEYSQILLNNKKIELIFKDDIYQAFWIEQSYCVTLTTNLSREEIEKIISDIRLK